MRRRDFITLFGAVALLPLAARGEDSSKRRRIAVLSGVARKVNSPMFAFERGLQELGYFDGQNIEIDYRYADGKVDRFPALAGERLLPRLSRQER
jgi:putative tryptophan/tyrosine transport system substrate-binding protein